jgi:hypothetical protein
MPAVETEYQDKIPPIKIAVRNTTTNTMPASWFLSW